MAGTVTTSYKLDAKTGNVISSKVIARDKSDTSLDSPPPPTITPTAEVVPVINKSDNYTKQVNDYLAQKAGTFGKVSVPASKLSQALNKANSARRYVDELGNPVELSTSQKAAIALQPYFASGKGNYGEVGRSQALSFYASQGLAPPPIESVADRSLAQQTKQGVFFTPSSTPSSRLMSVPSDPQQQVGALGGVAPQQTSTTKDFVFDRAEANKRYPLIQTETKTNYGIFPSAYAYEEGQSPNKGFVLFDLPEFAKNARELITSGEFGSKIISYGLSNPFTGGIESGAIKGWQYLKTGAEVLGTPYSATYRFLTTKTPAAKLLTEATPILIRQGVQLTAAVTTWFGVRKGLDVGSNIIQTTTIPKETEMFKQSNITQKQFREAGFDFAMSKYQAEGKNWGSQQLKGFVGGFFPGVLDEKSYSEGQSKFLAQRNITEPKQVESLLKYGKVDLKIQSARTPYEIFGPEIITNIWGGKEVSLVHKAYGGVTQFIKQPKSIRVAEYAKTRGVPGLFEAYASVYGAITNVPTTKGGMSRSTEFYSWETPPTEKSYLTNITTTKTPTSTGYNITTTAINVTTPGYKKQWYDIQNKEGKILVVGQKGLAVISMPVGWFSSRTFAKFEAINLPSPSRTRVVNVIGQTADPIAEPIGDFMTSPTPRVGKVVSFSYTPTTTISESRTRVGSFSNTKSFTDAISLSTFQSKSSSSSQSKSQSKSNTKSFTDAISLSTSQSKSSSSSQSKSDTTSFVNTAKIPLGFISVPGKDLFGRQGAKSSRGSLFSQFTPNIRGIVGINLGRVATKGQTRFSGLEIRPLTFNVGTRQRKTKRRKK